MNYRLLGKSGLRVSEANFLPSGKFVPRNRVVYHWFDAYGLVEERL